MCDLLHDLLQFIGSETVMATGVGAVEAEKCESVGDGQGEGVTDTSPSPQMTATSLITQFNEYLNVSY